MSSVRRGLAALFLPRGYPASVSSDYAAYQAWDTLQGLASYVAGSLSSRAILAGLGVGSATASAAGAVSVTLVRDAIGMAASVGCAALAPRSMEAFPQWWRLVADVLNDAALFAELLSALLDPIWFVWLVCGAALMRAVVGVAGGTSRAVFRAHQARNANLADVIAKDGSQETFVSLLGLLLGLLLAPVLDHASSAAWAVFAAATALHLAANWAAVSCLVLDSLNEQRMAALLAADAAPANDHLPSPAHLAATLPLSPWAAADVPFALGAPLSCLGPDGSCEIAACWDELGFIVDAHGHAALFAGVDATGSLLVKAAYFAAAAARDGRGAGDVGDHLWIAATQSRWCAFAAAAHRAGWDVDHRAALHLGTGPRVAFCQPLSTAATG